MGVYSGAGVYGGFGGAQGGDAPGGSAGGDLSGTYPNPAVAQIASGLLKFAGATSSFPALKRNGANLEVRLADDSGYSGLTTSNIVATAGAITTTLSVGTNLTVTGLSLVSDGAKTAPSIARASAPGTGFYFTAQQVVFAHGNVAYWSMDTSRLRGTANAGINWSSGSDPTVTGPDVGLARFAAGVLRVCGGEPGAAGGALATGDPTSGDGPAHKFGAVKAAVSALDTANYWEVSIGGVTKKVALIT